jgi:hypothetical protein
MYGGNPPLADVEVPKIAVLFGHKVKSGPAFACNNWAETLVLNRASVIITIIKKRMPNKVTKIYGLLTE